MIQRALEVRRTFEKFEQATVGKTWSRENLAQGFVVDVGDLMKLIMAKEGVRKIDDVDEKLAHELSDCLWSVIILAHMYEINLEQEFVKNMETLRAKIEAKLAAL